MNTARTFQDYKTDTEITTSELDVVAKKTWEDFMDARAYSGHPNFNSRVAIAVDFAECWGKLMQKEIENGTSLEEIADYTSQLACQPEQSETDSKYAVAILCDVWRHGPDLRKWYDKSYGVTLKNRGNFAPRPL